jgi:hypothetical protein
MGYMMGPPLMKNSTTTLAVNIREVSEDERKPGDGSCGLRRQAISSGG